MDRVYMLVRPAKGDVPASVWYSPPARNTSDCWRNAEEWEQWCRGGACIVGWREDMKRKGYRAQQARIEK